VYQSPLPGTDCVFVLEDLTPTFCNTYHYPQPQSPSESLYFIMHILIIAGLTLGLSLPVAYIVMPHKLLKRFVRFYVNASTSSLDLFANRRHSPKVLKIKDSSATSSIIMRRFKMQDPTNEPFVGFCKQFDDHRGVLVDVGAWSDAMDL
jgi:hypothetical protein